MFPHHRARPGGIVLTSLAITGTLFAAGRPTPAAVGANERPAAHAEAARSDVATVPLYLSETGLYDPAGSIDPRNVPFVPQYPLWSDGAVKSRWIYLPEGTKIDVSQIDSWRFPAGTTFWKQFAWGDRKVETRMLRNDGRDWVFATYVWNEDQTDARLAPASGIPDVVEVAPGRRHSIPGIADCDACHRSSPTVVLGFNALQLSDDRDPLAPHAEAQIPGMLTLRSLVEADRLEPRRPELVSVPPRVRESSPTARAALGYLSANCGGCHNDSGPLARLGLNLLHEVGAERNAPEPVRRTAIDAVGRYPVPGVAAGGSRIVAPGAPERSALLYRMQSRRPSSQMPPLGTVVADEQAVELVRRWIAELTTPEALVAAAGAPPAESRPPDPTAE